MWVVASVVARGSAIPNPEEAIPVRLGRWQADTPHMGQHGLRDGATCRREFIVTLHPWEWSHCMHIGAERHRGNWFKEDSENYRLGREAGRIQPESIASPRAAVTENGVAIWTGEYWSGSAWHANEHDFYSKDADVGRNIEVRSVVSENHGAKIHRHQLNQGLTLWVGYAIPDEYYQVKILGWLPHDLAWDMGTAVHYGKGPCPTNKQESDRQVALNRLYHPLHTQASAQAAADPTQAPTHQQGCQCRGCLGLLTQVYIPR